MLHYARYGRRLAAVCLLGLALSYLFTLISPFEGFVTRLETETAVRLNGFMLDEPLWDWTIFLFSSRTWLMIAMLIGTVFGLVAARRMFNRDYGRVIGYLVLTAVIAVATDEIADEISEVIKRPSPLSSGLGLIDPVRIQDPDLRIPHETGLPAEDVACMACLAFLLFVRLPRLGLTIFGITLLHCFGQLSIGNRWLMDMITAVFFGGLVAGGALWGGRGLFALFERDAERILLSDLWWLVPGGRAFSSDMARLRRLGEPSARSAAPLSFSLDDRLWRRMIDTEVLPLFGIPPGEAHATRKPPGGVSEGWKSSRYVRFIELPSSEVLVVKFAWRFGGSWHRSRRIRKYAESARSSLTLEKLGQPVPRVYWGAEGVSHLGFVRYFLLVEEFIRGRPLEVKHGNEVGAAMRVLAGLHRIESTTWGGVAGQSGSKGSHPAWIWLRLRPDVAGWLRRVAGRRDELWPDGIEEGIWKRFESVALALMDDSPPAFRLIHGDVGIRNFMWSGEGVRLIDFVTVRYDLPGTEIIRAARNFGRRDPANTLALWRAYFDEAGEERWREFLRSANLSLARYALRELAQDRVKKFKKTPLDELSERLPGWIDGMLDLDPRVWGDSPDRTDWKTLLTILQGDSWLEARESGAA